MTSRRSRLSPIIQDVCAGIVIVLMIAVAVLVMP